MSERSDVVTVLDEVDSFVKREHSLLIGGKQTHSHSERMTDVFDPASGAVLTRVSAGDEVDVYRAVEAARDAFEGPWRRFTPSDRANVLWRLADLIESRLEEFAQLDAIDIGKPLSLARGEVPFTVRMFRYMAGWSTKLTGETFEITREGNWHAYTRKEPLGVVGAIIPWNWPLMNVSVKLAPALATGNTVVLKPAEQSPLSALRFGELVEEAGFPPGVINIVTGSGDVAGASLVAHPGVDRITFTGSTSVGKTIVRSASADLKRVGLELGGKSACIVFSDADMNAAIKAAARAMIHNSGQACVATSRVLVQAESFDEIVSGVVEIAENAKVGPPLNLASQMGPLISKEQQARVRGYLKSGAAEGARVAGKGTVPTESHGYYVPPTVLVDAREEMAIQREEIFGPVITITPFKDANEAIAMANNSKYGLAAACFTSNMSTAFQVTNALQTGMVYVNNEGAADVGTPFGGMKQSGWGREFGKDGVEEYLETKSVFVRF